MPGLSAPEVAARLGVKLDTVYAYVSRGALTARRDAGTRRSLFDPEEVETLARRGRPRRGTRPAALDLVVETDLATIVGRRLRYRGRDAGAMARTHAFEQVARWLWTGDDAPAGAAWEGYPVGGGTEPARVRDRIRAAVVLASAAEPLRSDLGTPAVTAAAQALIATMVAAVTPAPGAGVPRLVLEGRTTPVRGSVAGRLWSALSPARPVPGLVTAVNAALVLLADHELAASTVAARAAASVRADPFSVVLAGLGPLAGPLHGGAGALAHQMMADAIRRGTAPALATALETYGRLPGFGHPLYPDGDPRARILLDLIRAATPATTPAARVLRTADGLVDAARRHSRTEPNVDFALATLAGVARMPASAGETIFAIARTAGWVAHAIEEYAEPPLRFRARAVPRPPGPPPGPPARARS